MQEAAPLSGTELNHATARAGHDPRAAVDHVQRRLASTGGTVTAATHAALDEASVLPGKMVAEAGFALGRFGEAYQALGKAVERLGEQLGQPAAH